MQRVRPISFADSLNDGSTAMPPGNYPTAIALFEFTQQTLNFPVDLDVVTGLVTDNLLATYTAYVDPDNTVINLGASYADFLAAKNIQIHMNGKKLTKQNLDPGDPDAEVIWVSSTTLRILREIDAGEDIEIWA